MNSTEISGTPRISSMYTVQTALTAGMSERLPSATIMASGKAATIDSVASSTVSGSPPQRSVGTGVRPKYSPLSKPNTASITASQSSTSQRLQSARVQLATSRATISSVATNGRHCSSKG